MENIKNKINYILEQKLGIDKQKLTPEAFLQEFDFDEIDQVMLIICLEDDFEIMIDDQMFAELKTLDELYNFIAQQLKLVEQSHQKTSSQ